jgi:hypothetical protein
MRSIAGSTRAAPPRSRLRVSTSAGVISFYRDAMKQSSRISVGATYLKISSRRATTVWFACSGESSRRVCAEQAKVQQGRRYQGGDSKLGDSRLFPVARHGSDLSTVNVLLPVLSDLERVVKPTRGRFASIGGHAGISSVDRASICPVRPSQPTTLADPSREGSSSTLEWPINDRRTTTM